MGSGMGMPCCKNTPSLVLQYRNGAPLQFFRSSDRIFVSDFLHLSPSIFGEYVDGASHVVIGTWDAADPQQDWQLVQYTNGSITDTQSIETNLLGESGWDDFVQCQFGSSDETAVRLLTVFASNAFQDTFAYSQQGVTNLSTRRVFDIGASLYDVPEIHGDSPIESKEASNSGRSSAGRVYVFDYVNNDVEESSNEYHTGSLRSPQFGSGNIARIECQTSTVDEGLQGCIASLDFPPPTADRVAGGAGLFVSYLEMFLALRPRYASSAVRWGVRGTGIANDNVLCNQSSGSLLTYALGDKLDVLVEWLTGGTTVRMSVEVNGTAVSMRRPAVPASIVDYIEVAMPLIRAPIHYRPTAGSVEPFEIPSIDDRWSIGYADYIRASHDGTGYNSDRFAGFDVEYDNVADLANVSLNGKWTLRNRRSVAIRPTSWGMQWPIEYTATGLPPGLSIGETGIIGSPTASSGTGTAIVTATDDNGQSIVTNHDWEIVS